MASTKPAEEPGKFLFSSSIAADVWHPDKPPGGYEWWYFDALSDDGKDAVVIIFLDNFVFSPRYNAQCRKANKRAGRKKVESPENPKSEIGSPQSNVPALAFIYYHQGKPLYRAINEFPSADFTADTELPACSLGENGFRFESAPYGSGYLINIKTTLPRRRKIEAKLEWLSMESDFLPREKFGGLQGNLHFWNLVSARSDVTGNIKVTDEKGKSLDVRHFRGTGYHDHNADCRWLPAAVKNWQWGRAHFADATAVFYRYRELNESEPLTKLILIKNSEFKIYDAYYEERRLRRSIFGLKYPQEISLSTEEGIRLNILQTKPIDESFFYLRFLSQAGLESPVSPTQETFAITEYLAPKALKYRWLDWLINMRIGRNGKGAFL